MCCRALVIAMNRPYFYFLFSHFILQFIDLMQYFPPMELSNYSIANCSFTLSLFLLLLTLVPVFVHFLWCRVVCSFIYLFWWNFCANIYEFIFEEKNPLSLSYFCSQILVNKRKKIQFQNFIFVSDSYFFVYKFLSK